MVDVVEARDDGRLVVGWLQFSILVENFAGNFYAIGLVSAPGQ